MPQMRLRPGASAAISSARTDRLLPAENLMPNGDVAVRSLLNATLPLMQAPPINLGVICRWLGIEVYSQPCHAFGALFLAGKGRSILLVNSSQPQGRARFSVAHELGRFLTTLGTISTVTPLMGLFGTVIGMIEIFGSTSPGGTNPQQLAHGISVALYNTGFGLIIAIPSLIAYRHFRAQVDDFVVEMEQQAIKLVEVLHGERR